MKLVVDAAGGDHGAKAVVEGILYLLEKEPDVEVIAVGKKEELTALKEKCRIIDAKDVVPMECGVLEVMRRKESSIYQAVDVLIKEKADGIVSAGSTGALLALASLKIGRLPGVIRPALITPFPTKIKDKWCVLLDVGASSENTPEELAQFAALGSAYVKSAYGIKEPDIRLISNGTEAGKGTPLLKKAYELLKDHPGFHGYIEGRDVLSGETDVIIFDGFTGNVFLKTAEGVAKLMSSLLKGAFLSSFSAKIGYLYAKKGIASLKDRMDYKKVGGALLIGVTSVVVKAHGNSDGPSFYHSLALATRLIRQGLLTSIKQELNDEAAV